MNLVSMLALLVQEPATDAAPEPQGLGSMMVPLLIVLGLFYVIMLGPERKQRKKREELLAALKKGQKVMTTGGLYGTIAAVNDDIVTLQVADGVRLRFSRSSIQGLTETEESDDKKDAEKASSAKG